MTTTIHVHARLGSGEARILLIADGSVVVQSSVGLTRRELRKAATAETSVFDQLVAMSKEFRVKVIPRDLMTDAEFDAIIEAGKNQPTYARATAVSYIRAIDGIVVTFDNGIDVAFPRTMITEMADKAPEQIARVEVTDGDALRWDEFDVDYYLPNMMDGFAPSCRAQAVASAAAIGRVGGSKKSAAKTAAVRANGMKGGRPRAAVVG